MTILSPGMGLKNPTDSLRKPGEGVEGSVTLTLAVESRNSCRRKLGLTARRDGINYDRVVYQPIEPVDIWPCTLRLMKRKQKPKGLVESPQQGNNRRPRVGTYLINYKKDFVV